MKRIHIAIATQDLTASIEDYSKRIGSQPAVVVPGEYALWRTQTLNFSVRQDLTSQSGELRHLGWEDDLTDTFTIETDCNGIGWEHFSAHHQAAEINEIWPDAQYVLEEISER